MITKFKIFENHDQIMLDQELYHSARNIASLQRMKDLIKNGANVNFKTSSGWTTLMNSSYKNFFSGVKLLIENRANVNDINRDGFSAIMLAASDKYSFEKRKSAQKIIDILIENGADLNIQNTKGQDIFDINDKLHKYISNKFPNEYKNYLFRKKVKKYNI